MRVFVRVLFEGYQFNVPSERGYIVVEGWLDNSKGI